MTESIIEFFSELFAYIRHGKVDGITIATSEEDVELARCAHGNRVCPPHTLVWGGVGDETCRSALRPRGHIAGPLEYSHLTSAEDLEIRTDSHQRSGT